MTYLADYAHPGPVRKLLKSLVPAVCPPAAQELGLDDDIVAHVELSMRAAPVGVRAALLTGLAGYELAAMTSPAHLGRRASQLSPDRARAYFSSWYESKLLPRHELAKGIKSLLCLACYEQPAMMESIGYRPQAWIDQSRRYRLRTYSESIARRERELLRPDPLPGVRPRRAHAEPG